MANNFGIPVQNQVTTDTREIPVAACMVTENLSKYINTLWL